MKKMTIKEMELAVIRKVNLKNATIVANISWGLGLHECDLLKVTKAGIATEFEIKTSKADLLKDKLKSHGHYSEKIRYLYFVVPENLREIALAEIPDRAGLYSVSDLCFMTLVKHAEINKNARKFNEYEIDKLKTLGCMRIFLSTENAVRDKEIIIELKNKIKTLEKNEAKNES